MTADTVAVLMGGVGLIAFLAWFFFGPKEGKHATTKAGVQEITITVEGHVPAGSHSGAGRGFRCA